MGSLENLLEKQRRYEVALKEKTNAERNLKWAKEGVIRQTIGIPLSVSCILVTIVAGIGSIVDMDEKMALLLLSPCIAVFPILCLILGLSKRAKIGHLKKELARLEEEIKRLKTELPQTEKKIEQPHQEARIVTPSSGVENTDYYKEKFNEYYNTYMGNPQPEKKSDTNTDALGDHMRTHYGDNWGDY